MIRIHEAIAVEGRYDKNTLSQVVDTLIIELRGFGIFTNRPGLELLRLIAITRGLIVLTDSDASGLKIRNYLKGAIPVERLKHAYIPDIEGRERRKSSPSKEGKLGVEGMSPEVLIRSLERAGATFDRDVESRATPSEALGARFDSAFAQTLAETFGDTIERIRDSGAHLSKADFYVAGLSGRPDSAERRRKLFRELSLPANLSSNALLDVLNFLLF